MTDPVVTDHALVRWLERAHGFDFSASRAKIADVVAGAAVGARSVKKDGLEYMISEGAVITIKPYNRQRTRGVVGRRPRADEREPVGE